MYRQWISGLSLAVVCSMAGCATQAVVGERKIAPASAKEIQLLLDRVKEINLGSPDSFSAQFKGDGILKKKKINFTGEALFNKNPRMLKYTFLDTVFKSIMTVLVQDGDSLKFYLPMDKSLLLDNIRTIRLKNYLDIDADFSTMYPLAVGQIPLITDYTIKSGYAAGNGNDPAGGQRYIILENDMYFETISFKGSDPDKILLVNKSTKQKIEIYLEKPVAAGKSVFYRTARFILFPSGDRLSISFKDVRLNAPVDIASVQKLNLERGTKFINMEK